MPGPASGRSRFLTALPLLLITPLGAYLVTFSVFGRAAILAAAIAVPSKLFVAMPAGDGRDRSRPPDSCLVSRSTVASFSAPDSGCHFIDPDRRSGIILTRHSSPKPDREDIVIGRPVGLMSRDARPEHAQKSAPDVVFVFNWLAEIGGRVKGR